MFEFAKKFFKGKPTVVETVPVVENTVEPQLHLVTIEAEKKPAKVRKPRVKKSI